jgi:hypothetical protein
MTTPGPVLKDGEPGAHSTVTADPTAATRGHTDDTRDDTSRQ